MDKATKLVQVTNETYSALINAKGRMMQEKEKHITFDELLRYLIEKTFGIKIGR